MIVTATKSRIKKVKEKSKLLDLEQAFTKIEKFHTYYEKGIITEEEYKDARCRVLKTLSIDETKT